MNLISDSVKTKSIEKMDSNTGPSFLFTSLGIFIQLIFAVIMVVFSFVIIFVVMLIWTKATYMHVGGSVSIFRLRQLIYI